MHAVLSTCIIITMDYSPEQNSFLLSIFCSGKNLHSLSRLNLFNSLDRVKYGFALRVRCLNSCSLVSLLKGILWFSLQHEKVAKYMFVTHVLSDVTRDDSQRRFLAQHNVATLFRIGTALFQQIVFANRPV